MKTVKARMKIVPINSKNDRYIGTGFLRAVRMSFGQAEPASLPERGRWSGGGLRA